jgi:hypothetical protein
MKNNPHNGKVFKLYDFQKSLIGGTTNSLRNKWDIQDKKYEYSSTDKTEMLTIVFTRNI